MRDTDNVAQLYSVVEFESIVEEEEIVTRATWLHKGKTEKVTNTYITHIVMQTMHPTGKFLGTLTDEACEYFILWYDLYKFRKQWLYMVEQINHMGFELKRIEKPVSNTIPTPCPLTEVINSLK